MRFGPFVDLVFDGLFLVEVGDYFLRSRFFRVRFFTITANFSRFDIKISTFMIRVTF